MNAGRDWSSSRALLTLNLTVREEQRNKLEQMASLEVPGLGSAPRRSALRKNRRLACAEMIMAADATKEIQLEIGHVLFIDIVGYSTLSVNEQHRPVEELNQDCSR
jgi:hypothetical protein